MHKHSWQLSTIAFICFPVLASAELSPEAAEYVATIQRNTVSYSGATSPDNITLVSRLDALFRNYIRPDNASVLDELALTDRDKQTITQFVADSIVWEEDRARDASRNWHYVCANLDTYEPTMAAQAFEDFENDYRLQKRLRYEMLLEGLPTRARNSINVFVLDRVLPGLSVTTIDLVGVASENPKAFAELLRYRCAPTPAELTAHREAFEEAMESLPSQVSSSSSSNSQIGSLPD